MASWTPELLYDYYQKERGARSRGEAIRWAFEAFNADDATVKAVPGIKESLDEELYSTKSAAGYYGTQAAVGLVEPATRLLELFGNEEPQRALERFGETYSPEPTTRTIGGVAGTLAGSFAPFVGAERAIAKGVTPLVARGLGLNKAATIPRLARAERATDLSSQALAGAGLGALENPEDRGEGILYGGALGLGGAAAGRLIGRGIDSILHRSLKSFESNPEVKRAVQFLARLNHESPEVTWANIQKRSISEVNAEVVAKGGEPVNPDDLITPQDVDDVFKAPNEGEILPMPEEPAYTGFQQSVRPDDIFAQDAALTQKVNDRNLLRSFEQSPGLKERNRIEREFKAANGNRLEALWKEQELLREPPELTVLKPPARVIPVGEGIARTEIEDLLRGGGGRGGALPASNVLSIPKVETPIKLGEIVSKVPKTEKPIWLPALKKGNKVYRGSQGGTHADVMTKYHLEDAKKIEAGWIEAKTNEWSAKAPTKRSPSVLEIPEPRVGEIRRSSGVEGDFLSVGKGMGRRVYYLEDAAGKRVTDVYDRLDSLDALLTEKKAVSAQFGESSRKLKLVEGVTDAPFGQASPDNIRDLKRTSVDKYQGITNASRPTGERLFELPEDANARFKATLDTWVSDLKPENRGLEEMAAGVKDASEYVKKPRQRGVPKGSQELGKKILDDLDPIKMEENLKRSIKDFKNKKMLEKSESRSAKASKVFKEVIKKGCP